MFRTMWVFAAFVVFGLVCCDEQADGVEGDDGGAAADSEAAGVAEEHGLASGESGEAAAVSPESPPDGEKPRRRFIEVRGDVKIDGKAAKSGEVIGDKATLATGKDGYAIITLEPGGIVEVRANSNLSIGESKRASRSLTLAFGRVWSFVADDSSYEVVTPNAVAGVRGTIFFVEVEKPKKKRAKPKSYICACHGKVAIQAANKKSFDEVIHSPSEDHKAFDVITRGKKQKVKKAKRRNHTDDEKMALMPFIERAE